MEREREREELGNKSWELKLFILDKLNSSLIHLVGYFVYLNYRSIYIIQSYKLFFKTFSLKN